MQFFIKNQRVSKVKRNENIKRFYGRNFLEDMRVYYMFDKKGNELHIDGDEYEKYEVVDAKKVDTETEKMWNITVKMIEK